MICPLRLENINFSLNFLYKYYIRFILCCVLKCCVSVYPYDFVGSNMIIGLIDPDKKKNRSRRGLHLNPRSLNKLY
jgi:hypothetical protein